MRRPKKTVGIPWYTIKTYAACREMMADREILPMGYEEWRAYAEQLSKRFEDAGDRALKVQITPSEFSIWCRTRDLAPDADARNRYAKFVVFRAMVS